MEQHKITDPVKAQAAIAYLISEGFEIDLAGFRKRIKEPLKPQDWIEIANSVLGVLNDRLARNKIIPISRYL